MKIIALICGIILLFSSSVYAQESAPFTIKSTRRLLVINTENQRTEHYLASNDSEDVRKRSFYKENLELSFEGSVYHPNLMNFNLDTQLGLSQQKEELGTGKSFDTASLGNLRLVTNWLAKKPYAFSLFVDKRNFTRNYEFFERVKTERTAVGGRGRWENKVVPIYYSLEKSNTRERRTTRPSAERELIFNFGGNKTSAKGNSDTRLDYTYNESERSTPGIYEEKGKTHNFRLSNDLVFGKKEGKRLSSYLYYLTLEGIQDMDSINLSEDLELKHSPNLSSRYSYGLDRVSNRGLKTTIQRGRFQIRHQLYESLTTTFNMHGYLTRATDYNEDSFGPGINLLYRKNIKVGFLTLSYNLTNDFKERRAFSQTILIFDESQTLTDGVVTLLNNPDIDAGSIVVTDSGGTIRYVLNSDYTVSTVGSRIQLSRIATGSIANGSTVLVDYTTTSSNPSFNYVSLRQGTGVRTDFFEGKLGFYYRLMSQRYPHSEEAENMVLETTKGKVVGASFNFRPFYGSVEQEKYESSISPYEALRVRQGFFLPLTRRSTLSFQSSQSFTRFQDTGEKQRFYDFMTQYRAPLGPFTFLNMEGGYRRQKGANIDLTLQTLRTYIEFRRGFLSFKVGYEFEDKDSWGDLRRDHYIYTEWRREF